MLAGTFTSERYVRREGSHYPHPIRTCTRSMIRKSTLSLGSLSNLDSGSRSPWALQACARSAAGRP